MIGNLITIKEKVVKQKINLEKKGKNLRVGSTFCLPTVMLQLSSYKNLENDHNHLLPPSITTTSPLQLLISICLLVTTTILCRPKVSYRPLIVISYLLQPKNSITTLKLLPLKAITILQQTYLPNPIDSTKCIFYCKRKEPK